MRIFFIFILSGLLLTACSPAQAAATSPTNSLRSSSAKPTSFNLGSCVDARQPTPAQNEASLFPGVNQHDHILGPDNAAVTVLVYSDFQCTSCANLSVLLESFVKKYPGDVRLVFRHFPLISIHDKSQLSAQAAEAAALQGKFWEMHDLLFTRQVEWQSQSPSEFQKWIIQQAPSIKLDGSRLAGDMTSMAVEKSVQEAWENGQKIKLPGAPVILINEEIIKWQANLLDQMESFVKLAMLSKKQFGSCPTLVIDPAKQYYATLKTTRGDIRIRLFQNKAPNTVNNFVYLAERGWFDNNPFFLVAPGSMLQTGDPSGTGLGGPGYFIPSEINSSLLYDRAGMVGMLNLGPDSNGSQFLITLAPAPQFNRIYPVFGEVVSGMDVLAALSSQNLQGATPAPKIDSLLSVLIEAK